MVSPVYETEPVGGPEQSDFKNLVVQFVWSGSAEELLELCRNIEQRAGRVREVVNGPRTLDVDILLLGDQNIESDDLIVPHPRMFERNFVLEPLLDLWPRFVDTDLYTDNRVSKPIGEVTKLGPLNLL